jgi:3-oxoacyl-[acyl-carrier-protein] synthase II
MFQGHLIGACGSAESAFVALALSEGKIPGNVNLETLDENIQQDNLTFPSEVTDIVKSQGSRKLILKNSFGFGGTNVSLLLGEYKP